MKGLRALEVRLWGEIVGYLAKMANGEIEFEYERSFLKSGLEISPIELPLATTRTFRQKNPATTFRGLPGVIADCLPDRFGMRVITEFYQKKYNLSIQEIDAIKLLLYIGNRSMGALEFAPMEVADDNDFLNKSLHISKLQTQAKKILEGNADEITSQIMRVSGSAGGARAKALIDYDPKKEQIRSGFSKAKAGFIPCIIKFDGVKDGEESNCYGRLEYIYSIMARQCELRMPKTYLLEEGGCAHFIIERFDRSHDKEKLYHFASLCGLTGKDYFQKHSCSYEEFFQVVNYLTNDISQVIDAFKMALFNFVFRNQDDHTKNFGFLMDQSGVWTLAPAYDLTYAYDAANANTHQMKFNFKEDHFELKDFITVGKKFGLKEKQIISIIDKTVETSKDFLSLAQVYKLDENFAQGVYRNFRQLF